MIIDRGASLIADDASSFLLRHSFPSNDAPLLNASGDFSSSDTIVSPHASTAPSLIRRPVRYEPISRRVLSLTMLKMPSGLKIQPTDFLDALDNSATYKILERGNCLDGKEPVARLRMNSGEALNVAAHADEKRGIVKIECYRSPEHKKNSDLFWERRTAARMERVVKNIVDRLIHVCRNQGLTNKQQGSSLIFFHKIDQHHENIRECPETSLANHRKHWHGHDILSGAVMT